MKSFFNIKSIIGILISVGGIYFSFRNIDVSDLKNELLKTNIYILLIASLLLILTVYWRGIRWRYLLIHIKEVPAKELYKAEMIGYFGSNVFPLRLGELMRSYFVSQQHDIKNSTVFGTIVFERLLDTMGLLFLSTFLVFFKSIDHPEIENFLRYGIIVGTIFFIVVLIVINRFETFEAKNKYTEIIRDFMFGMTSLKQKYRTPVILYTLLLWCSYWAITHLVQLSMDLDFSILQSLMILIITSLAMSIPAAPGMIGTFHLSVVFVMVNLFGYSDTDSQPQSFAIIYHAYGYISLTVVGAYYFFKSKFHENAFEDLKNLSSRKSKTEKP
jgi:glycosyltransferase 2 family protein